MTWAKGESGNPKGKPPGVFSTFSDTASRLLETLGREQIIAISDDEARLNTYPAFQCLVIRQLAGALKAGGVDATINMTEEREKLFDRVIGKPKQSIEVDANLNVTTTESALLEGRKRILNRSIDLSTPDTNILEVGYSVISDVNTEQK